MPANCFESVKRHLPSVYAYEDDTQLNLAFKPDCDLSSNEAISAVELCVCKIRAWMLCDKLKVNDDAEVIIITTRQQLAKVQVNFLTLCRAGDARVPFVSAVKNLGTWVNTNLSLQVHINNTCKAAYYHITNVRLIRKYLRNKASQILVQSVITGRLDYCNSILHGLSSINITQYL